MPSSHDIGAILPGQLISNREQAYIETDMARTKTPKAPSDRTADQIIAEMFPAVGGINPVKALEFAQNFPPPKGMSKDVWRSLIADAFLTGTALRQANDENSTVPTTTEDVLRFIATQPSVGKAFKALRTKLRITQEEIAKRAGVVRSVVADWERERVLLPSKAIQALCDVMATRVTEPPLLTGSDLFKLRKLLGITQAEMAAAVGTTSISIGNWERFGDRPLTREASAKVRERYEEQLEDA